MTNAAPPRAMFSRVERFGAVGSTNDVVRGWLADGVPEVCVAVADEQSAGRGRHGRTWTAPDGAALLLTAGFRPAWLEPDRTWRLGAIVAIAMADAAEDVAGLPVGAIRLKWPNDLVIEEAPLELRKLAGVLGESDGLGTEDPRVVVGLGINADWRAADFPPELAATMSSLREASGGRPVDRDALLAGFLDRLEGRVEALRAGFFDVGAWADRQATTGRQVTLEGHGGSAPETVDALGVDAATGALVVADPAAPGAERRILAGDVVRVRLSTASV